MTKLRDFNAAVEALNKLQTNFAVIEEINRRGAPARDEDLVPEMIEWTRRIGYSPADFDKLNVLHITGTKGKGSTSAFVQSILLQYKHKPLKVGLYTSPHLKSVCERIMIDGQPLSKEKFAKYFFQVFDRLEHSSSDAQRFPRMGPGIKPNYFRYLTLVSFHAFMEEKVDSAIYEVGIGGEYDSTNVFVHPVATAVTSLGIDHVNVLGNTIEQIAWNKAGIFKAGSPAFTIADQPPSGLKVLQERAAEKSTTLKVLDLDYKLPVLGLKGEFQRKNAIIAINLAAQRLGCDIESLPAPFKIGLETASWPGRCQILERKNKWYIDGAHTTDSLQLAAEWFASARTPTRKVTLVFNQQKRDEVEKLLLALYESLSAKGVYASDVYFTTNQSWESGFQADMISHNVSKDAVDKLVIQKQLADYYKTLDPKANIKVVGSLEAVVNQVNAEHEVFVAGSLLMVGGLLAVIDP